MALLADEDSAVVPSIASFKNWPIVCEGDAPGPPHSMRRREAVQGGLGAARRYWGKADINQPTIPAESVENDPTRKSSSQIAVLHNVACGRKYAKVRGHLTGGAHEAARVYSAARRCRCMAAHGSRAAARAYAADRCAHERRRRRSTRSGSHRGVPTNAATIGLD